MSTLSTHVLDTGRGRPAAGLKVRLAVQDGQRWKDLREAVTDGDGRVKPLQPSDGPLREAVYRLTFETGAYFEGLGAKCFYPKVEVIFEIAAPGEHYHVPLLLSPYGYSTYRGS